MYSLITNIDALKLMKEHHAEVIQDIPEHFARVYKLDNEHFIIVPKIGRLSILFQNKKEYEEFLKKPQYPVIENDPFLNEKDKIASLPNSIEYFYNKFNSILGTTLGRIDDKKKLDIFFNILLRNRKRIKDVYIPATIILGDFLCATSDFQWELKKDNFQFQEYYNPAVVHKSGIAFYHFWLLFKDASPDQLRLKYFENILSGFLETIRLNKEAIGE